ncbi:MAG: 30S ribosomal protein S8 [Candidatus Paceibacterota bacterium]|jgi:small subunit ribosomal protein S8
MTTTDPIADMLNRIKNAGAVQKDTVVVPLSKVKLAICHILEKEGYIGSAVVSNDKETKKRLEIKLSYRTIDKQKVPRINGFTRISKPSRRIYKNSSDLGGRHAVGVAVVSTNKGLLTGRQAVKENVGGEVLFKVW